MNELGKLDDEGKRRIIDAPQLDPPRADLTGGPP